MKISNETKIGILGVVVITIFIIGFNFLKGNKLFTKTVKLYAKYDNVQGLNASNPIIINGLQVGTVDKISNDKNMKELIVTFSIYKDINIPTNSLATINPNPLTLTKIEIKLGDANTYLKDQDTILTTPTKAYLEDVFGKVDPVVLAVKNAISSLDSLIVSVKNVVDVNNKNNISGTLENLTKITESILVSSTSLEQMLNKDNGPLAKTLNNASSISQNIAANNDKISGIISNLNKTTSNLAQMDLQKTLVTLDSTINNLKTSISKLNSTDGSVGLLLNDPTLYRNLTATSNKINILLDDVRMHPKRYISISMFGKKDKEQPLTVPLPDTVSAPYINK